MTDLRLVLGLLLRHPLAFCERVTMALERHRERNQRDHSCDEATDFEEATRSLERLFPVATRQIFAEGSLLNIEKRVQTTMEDLKKNGTLPFYENADMSLARMCYLVCRAIVPAVVLETGVAYGVTSAFILEALKMNAKGALWSIDLPPLVPEAERYVGALVPQEYGALWTLRLGPSKRILPGLLSELGSIDFFVHDSLHTYRNMRAEFEVVWPLLRPGGVLIADDVDQNSAFWDFAKIANPSFSTTVRQDEKEAAFGIMIKG